MTANQKQNTPAQGTTEVTGQAVATNEYDVQRQQLILELEKMKIESADQVEKMRIASNEKANRFNRVSRIVEKTILGGLASAVAVKALQYSTEVEKAKLEFGE